MISFEEARSIIFDNLPQRKVEKLPLEHALGRIIAEPVYCRSDSPPFDQSAMDGYAIRYSPGLEERLLEVTGSIPAGKRSLRRSGRYEAVRIFTGAPLPPGTDTVVMQEKVELSGNKIRIMQSGLSRGDNVRRKGSHVPKGKMVFDRGDKLTAGGVGLLASLGISKVAVYRHPALAVVVTGDELTPPGRRLKAGRIYESNSYALSAALISSGLKSEIFTYQSRDKDSELISTLSEALKKSSIMIVTGGVSVGDFDLVKPALQKLGAKILFHKVKQKPGKPFLVARKGAKLIFGLPGNPASVMSCYYAYIATALDRITGSGSIVERQLPAGEEIKVKNGLTLMLKASVKEGQVHLLNDQESYKLNSFATANALAIIGSEVPVVRKGDLVRVLQFLPSY